MLFQLDSIGLPLSEEIIHDPEVKILSPHRDPEDHVEMAEVTIRERVSLLILKPRNPPGVEAGPPEAGLARELHKNNS